jgi:hypothetical protein
VTADHEVEGYPRRRDGTLAARPGTRLLALKHVDTGEEIAVVIRRCPECAAQIMHDAGVYAECRECFHVSYG